MIKVRRKVALIVGNDILDLRSESTAARGHRSILTNPANGEAGRAYCIIERCEAIDSRSDRWLVKMLIPGFVANVRYEYD